MGTYTMELRKLIDDNFNIGLKDYPIFDENYREILNKKIIDHFYMREIGSETPSLFKFYLNRTMNENMPYFNKLYESEMLKISPLTNYETNENFESTQTGKGNVTGKNNTSTNVNASDENSSKNISSDTPQALITDDDVESDFYASNVDIVKNNSNSSNAQNSENSSESTNEITNENNYTKNNSGYTVSQSELLLKYRETFINIDILVLKSLENCFMQLY